jgi:hypothetical protein
MLPATRQAFVDEMRKIAASKEEAAEERQGKAAIGVMGANLGAFATVMALMKSPSQPGEAGAMRAHVKAMASKMKVPSSVEVSTPSGSEGHGWSPFYDPGSKSVNIPLHSRDSIIAHELGHAKNDQVLANLGSDVPYQVVQAISRIGSNISLIPTVGMAAKDEKMSYTPGIIQAIISSPMIAEEAAASSRATAHLIREHGVGKGVWKSLPLLPAFATYATIAGAPLLVTYLRRRAAEKEKAKVKEKKSSSRVASQLAVSYSSL